MANAAHAVFQTQELLEQIFRDIDSINSVLCFAGVNRHWRATAVKRIWVSHVLPLHDSISSLAYCIRQFGDVVGSAFGKYNRHPRVTSNILARLANRDPNIVADRLSYMRGIRLNLYKPPGVNCNLVEYQEYDDEACTQHPCQVRTEFGVLFNPTIWKKCKAVSLDIAADYHLLDARALLLPTLRHITINIGPHFHTISQGWAEVSLSRHIFD